jgi:hypothetical protein
LRAPDSTAEAAGSNRPWPPAARLELAPRCHRAWQGCWHALAVSLPAGRGGGTRELLRVARLSRRTYARRGPAACVTYVRAPIALSCLQLIPSHPSSPTPMVFLSLSLRRGIARPGELRWSRRPPRRVPRLLCEQKGKWSRHTHWQFDRVRRPRVCTCAGARRSFGVLYSRPVAS